MLHLQKHDGEELGFPSVSTSASTKIFDKNAYRMYRSNDQATQMGVASTHSYAVVGDNPAASIWKLAR